MTMTSHCVPTQPGTHLDPVDDLTDSEFERLTIPRESDLNSRDAITITYYRASDAPDVNPQDNLHDERVATVEPAADRSGDVVTVTIQFGDVFEFSTYTGRWMFVGTHVLYDQCMLFVPFNAAAHDAPLYPAYRTMYRADFAPKFAGNRDQTDIHRIESFTTPTQ